MKQRGLFFLILLVFLIQISFVYSGAISVVGCRGTSASCTTVSSNSCQCTVNTGSPDIKQTCIISNFVSEKYCSIEGDYYVKASATCQDTLLSAPMFAFNVDWAKISSPENGKFYAINSPISFSADGTCIPQDSSVTTFWDLDDDKTSNQWKFQESYSTRGQKNIMLTVTREDASGEGDKEEKEFISIIVCDGAGTYIFANISSPIEGEVVNNPNWTFSAVGSYIKECTNADCSSCTNKEIDPNSIRWDLYTLSSEGYTSPVTYYGNTWEVSNLFGPASYKIKLTINSGSFSESVEREFSASFASVCGDKKCTLGENCASCVSDCGCASNKACSSGVCVNPVNCDNDGTCDSGETCLTCSNDCSCESGKICDSTYGVCLTCDNDGTCETGETCASCVDCKCNSLHRVCQNEKCVPIGSSDWECVEPSRSRWKNISSNMLYDSLEDCEKDGLETCCPEGFDCVEDVCQPSEAYLCSYYETEEECEDFSSSVAKMSIKVKREDSKTCPNIISDANGCTYALENCRCSWDESSSQCGAEVDIATLVCNYSDYNKSTSFIAGSCTYTEKLMGDSCDNDGFLTYSWKAEWKWNPLNIFKMDPLKEAEKCVDGVRSIGCPSQISLPFFGVLEMGITAIAIIFIYYFFFISSNEIKRKTKRDRKIRKSK